MIRLGAGMRLRLVLAIVILGVLSAATLAHGAVDDTTLVSRADGQAGAPADAGSASGIAVSETGRYVAFTSSGDNLSPDDNDSVDNVYVRDTENGVTMLVSRAAGPNGAAADGDSRNPAISPRGHYVAFESDADDLSSADDNSVTNVFVRDLATGATVLVNQGDFGPADGSSHNPSISANGAFVAFDSAATNLSDQDDDTVTDVFLRDLNAGTTRLLSRPSSGAANGNSYDPSIAANGIKVAFVSEADNLMNIDIDAVQNVYVVDTRFGFATQVNRTSATGIVDYPGDGNAFSPAISNDGRAVAFASTSSNLGAAGNVQQQVYSRDVQANLTTLISRGAGENGAPGDAPSWAPSMASEGRVVAFVSAAANLGAGGNGAAAFLRYGVPVAGGTLRYEQTLLASRAGGAAGAPADGPVSDAAISFDATATVFLSTATNLGIDNPGGIAQLYTRESLFDAPPPPPPDLGSGEHPGGHGVGHDAGHASAEHAGGHGSGDVHFSIRMGKAGADRILGTPSHDKICGLGGSDTIRLEGGPDVAYGDMCGAATPPAVDGTAIASISASPPPSGASGNDTLVGGTGTDQLYGGWGNDRLVGGSGDDALYGGVGRDRLVGGPGSNIYRGGPGRDSINAANGTEDLVDCGAGRDTARVDRIDFVKGCETVRRIGTAKPGANKKDAPQLDPSLQLPECPGGGHACHENSNGGVIVVSRANRR